MRSRVQSLGCLLACLLLVGCPHLRGPADLHPPSRSTDAVAPVSEGIELLRDPGFAHGVTQAYANHLPPAERAECLARWETRGLADAQWAFWEISERLYFAHNPATPVLAGPGQYAWSTVDQTKQCLIDRGSVRFLFDTSKEWRDGGSLWLADATGNRPRYGNPATTWPHFLVGQHLVANNDAMYPIPEPEKLLLSKYKRLRFTLDVKLNRLERTSPWDHREEFGAADHALFYIGFAVMPKETQCIAQRGKFYVLIPAIYSEGGVHVQQSAPWLGIDQFGDGVFFAGSAAYPHLAAGAWVPYDVDVTELVREGLAAIAQRVAPQDRKRSLNPDDYFIAVLLIGWEVWGGFGTDVEFRGLSLRGYGEGDRSSHPLRHFVRGEDHRYATGDLSATASGYRETGVLGYVFNESGDPGLVPLYEYLNPASGLHLYATEQKPFGIAEYRYQRKIGEILGPGRGPPGRGWLALFRPASAGGGLVVGSASGKPPAGLELLGYVAARSGGGGT